MMRIGRHLRVELFGTSHGPAVGVEIDGLPRGLEVDTAAIQNDLDRRRPVGRRLATKRQEADRLVLDRGVRAGRATGRTLRAHVANTDVRRAPYERHRTVPRPGHADFPARIRFGAAADLSGGGIFSGRMTVGLVIAGAIARQITDPLGIRVVAFTKSIGPVEANVPETAALEEIETLSRRNEVGSPDTSAARGMESAIASARRRGDSVGGVVECRATGLPVGMGEPFFDSIESVVAHLAFSIPGVKGVEFGAGFSAPRMRGSEHNDPFEWRDGAVRTRSNHAGGILGGLATGAPLVMRVAIKPTSSIALLQDSVDLVSHAPVRLRVEGRHDPCIVPRAVVVVEAVTRLAIADLLLAGGYR